MLLSCNNSCRIVPHGFVITCVVCFVLINHTVVLASTSSAPNCVKPFKCNSLCIYHFESFIVQAPSRSSSFSSITVAVTSTYVLFFRNSYPAACYLLPLRHKIILPPASPIQATGVNTTFANPMEQ
jgi:hypothetical protein